MNDLVLVIIDDEPKARELLKNYIQLIVPSNSFQFVLCNSVQEGKKAIETHLPDLVFLDIEMPEANGFELFNIIDKECFEVVFVTAYSEYMDKSVNEIGCFGYLNKPIERDKLKRIFDRYNEKSVIKKHLKFIHSNQNKRVLINLKDVVYCKADDNYCEVYMNDGKTKHLLSKTLKNIEAELSNENFYRVHRSYIINMNYVDLYESDKSLLSLKHSNIEWEQKIPVSVTYKDKIRKLFL